MVFNLKEKIAQKNFWLKKPLVIPPDYNKLPNSSEDKIEENQIEKLFEKDNEDKNVNSNNNENKTTENFI